MRSRKLLGVVMFLMAVSFAVAGDARNARSTHRHRVVRAAAADCSACPNQCWSDLNDCVNACGSDNDCQTGCFASYDQCDARCNLIDC